ncbi:hypothetical protein [Streptomyces sp. NPDC047976]|uniref:hypothetical protein n=1 Tax=Streptomyces sp. NPDC047976 TaxID=3155746 RepID=UPI00341917D7
MSPKAVKRFVTQEQTTVVAPTAIGGGGVDPRMTAPPEDNAPMSGPVLLSQGCLDALHHLKEKRDVRGRSA